MKRYHVGISLDALEERLKSGKGWDLLCYPDGKPYEFSEVWEQVRECRAMGWEVIPFCREIDAGGHCLGHEVDSKETVKN